MRGFILGLMLVFVAAPGASEPVSGKKVKATFSTSRPASEVAPCVSEALSWWEQKSSLPAPDGGTRIQLLSLYVTLTDILVTPRDGSTVIELRGKAYSKAKRSIEGCL
jgi:hypothetical protein